ncbi:MAG: hypothetical protein EOP47_25950 [Sphingobacteriaceae bacterium]|nr:MAG: hypothetical protein EOP47_25950 [Sphingobacteriaceae bacterium]
MVLSNLQRLKVILLVSGYLFIVVTHLLYLKPSASVFLSRLHNTENSHFKEGSKSKYAILIVKKIEKTVLNRLTDRDLSEGLHLNFVKLLTNRSPYLSSDPSLRYCTRISTPQIKRCFYLRI